MSTPGREPKILSTCDVLSIHEALTREFAEQADPISPAGVKDFGLLESAVDRQRVGSGNKLKYEDAWASAATLAYGICMNHAFHNGNKRTAVVATLAHLEKNGLQLNDVGGDFLYNLFVSFTDHRIHLAKNIAKLVISDAESVRTARSLGLGNSSLKSALSVDVLRNPDLEVHCLATWLRRSTRPVSSYDRNLTLRELRRVVAKFGIELVRTNNVQVDVMRPSEVRKRTGFLGLSVETRRELLRVYTFSCGAEKREVGYTTVKDIRRLCNLRNEDGVDADAFYGDVPTVDYFIAHYSSLLKRLART